ncbi:hypothetical protein AHF37_02213 [Paragonimus kellicotti]|nr:hypothetical protein AHF37_02213 [Paragonimus kellicotti]
MACCSLSLCPFECPLSLLTPTVFFSCISVVPIIAACLLYFQASKPTISADEVSASVVRVTFVMEGLRAPRQGFAGLFAAGCSGKFCSEDNSMQRAHVTQMLGNGTLEIILDEWTLNLKCTLIRPDMMYEHHVQRFPDKIAPTQCEYQVKNNMVVLRLKKAPGSGSWAAAINLPTITAVTPTQITETNLEYVANVVLQIVDQHLDSLQSFWERLETSHLQTCPLNHLQKLAEDMNILHILALNVADVVMKRHIHVGYQQEIKARTALQKLRSIRNISESLKLQCIGKFTLLPLKQMCCLV